MLHCQIYNPGKIAEVVARNQEDCMIASMHSQEEWKINLIIFGPLIMKELVLG